MLHSFRRTASFAAMIAMAGLLPATASAADLYTAPAHDWTGFYAGGHIGGAFGDKDWDRIQGVGGGGGGPQPGISSYDVDGIIGGGQIGYNMQSGSWVFGLEAEVSGAGVDGTDRPRANWFETDVNLISTVTGRAGMAVDQLLFFAEGGLAIVNEDHAHNSNFGVVSDNETRLGWTVGGGVEWAFNDTWSAEVEYNYIDLGSEQVTLTGPGGSGIFDIDQQLHTVKFGVNMKF